MVTGHGAKPAHRSTWPIAVVIKAPDPALAAFIVEARVRIVVPRVQAVEVELVAADWADQRVGPAQQLGHAVLDRVKGEFAQLNPQPVGAQRVVRFGGVGDGCDANAWLASTILTAKRQLSWPAEAGNEFDCLLG